MDALRLGEEVSQDVVEYVDPNEGPATEKQIAFLQHLITEKVTDEDEMTRWQNELGELTRKEASEAIANLKG